MLSVLYVKHVMVHPEFFVRRGSLSEFLWRHISQAQPSVRARNRNKILPKNGSHMAENDISLALLRPIKHNLYLPPSIVKF